ncbi:MAG: M56 family metallopeptidase [Pirellulales bacterium]
MQLLLEALTYHRGSDEPLSVMVILVARVTMVLVTGWLVSRACARSSAAVGHRVWLLAMLGTLVVPIVWALTPDWRVPLVAVHVEGSGWPRNLGPAAESKPPLWSELLVVIWIAGTLVGLGYMVLGIVSARRLFGGSRPCADAAWLDLLSDLRRETGLTGRVELRVTGRSMSPAVWSFGRVQILVPEESLAWPLAQRRSVLLHELAHVARRDCVSQMVAAVACAVWWFHPLAWHAARQVRAFGELAADDYVIRAGGNRADYAGQLLAIAARLGWARLPAVAQTMFHPSHLERRLRAILDPARRRDALDSRRSAASILSAFALMIPLATLTPSVIRALPNPAAGDSLPAGKTLDVEVYLKLRMTVPATPVQWPPGYRRYLEPKAELPAQPPLAPPPATFELIPNWEAGQHAEMLIPNYVPGMAQVLPVDPLQASTAQTLSATAVAPPQGYLGPSAVQYTTPVAQFPDAPSVAAVPPAAVAAGR